MGTIHIPVSAFVLLASFMTAEWEFLLHDRQAILNLSSSALPKNVLSVGSPDWSDNVVQVSDTIAVFGTAISIKI